MVSRDTIVHLVAVGVAFVVLFAAEYADAGPDTDFPPLPAFVLFYGLVLGGAHFYLAVRGDDGMVPVESRWRYVTMLVVLLGTGTAVAYGGDRTVATVELRSIGVAIIAVTVVAYVLAESVDGYRASRTE